MHYIALYVISIIIYFLIIMVNLFRGFRKKSRYDYWTAGYLYDSERPFLKKLLLILIYSSGIFIMLLLYEIFWELRIPIF